jgi:plasmid stability protein
MATLTVKNIPDDLYQRLKMQAEANHRSINGEIIACIESSVRSRGIDPEQILADARRIREITSQYAITDAELDKAMHKKLTIAIDEQVYEGLLKTIGSDSISRFIEDLVRPYVIFPELDAAYRQMAEDEQREAEALDWAEATVGDVSDETR